MKHIIRFILPLIYICHLTGCIGPEVPAYKTKSQKFKWGKAYVWMSSVAGTRSDATTGEGYLLMNMFYKKSYRNKNCAITINHVSMTDLKSGVVLIDQTPFYSDNSPMTKEIAEYRTDQFSLRGLTFEFDRDSFPYDLDIKMSLKCPNKKTEHNFTKKIRFRMGQPVIWEQ